MSYDAMKASVERRKRASFVPDSYGFEGITVEYATEALNKGARDPRIIVKLGLKEDGSPEAWLIVKGGDDVLYVGNAAYTCPPRPPADCAD